MAESGWLKHQAPGMDFLIFNFPRPSGQTPGVKTASHVTDTGVSLPQSLAVSLLPMGLLVRLEECALTTTHASALTTLDDLARWFNDTFCMAPSSPSASKTQQVRVPPSSQTSPFHPKLPPFEISAPPLVLCLRPAWYLPTKVSSLLKPSTTCIQWKGGTEQAAV